jgi:L-alanine-DL-glutamate epimerase-like enolase superfamily enzyme
MTNPRVIDAEVAFAEQPFIRPLILSSCVIDRITLATASVRVRVGGIEAEGKGSIYLSDLWAWPDGRYSHAERDAHLRTLGQLISDRLRELTGADSAHPLELGLRLLHAVHHLKDDRFAAIPPLARAMCLSPFDAAIHDAVGIALRCSALRFYDDPCEIPSADSLFNRGACRAIAMTLRKRPRSTLPAWLIVGKADDLERDVRPMVRDCGYRCFKLKIMGRDTADDVQRTIDVFNAVRSFGARHVWLSIDSNEGNPDAASVLDYLVRLRERSREAFQALRYLEQPTGRDIELHRFDWSRVTRMKPVLLDEGLTDLRLLPIAAEQGWSGFALKTCKGHSFALVAAAWAKEHGMVMSLQDLTNPGYSLIHAAMLGAHLPTINGAELNSPQFTPAANAEWIAQLPRLFRPQDGVHEVPSGSEIGLASKIRRGPVESEAST